MFNNFSFYMDLSPYLSMLLFQLLTLISAMIYRQRYTESRTAQRYLYGIGSLLGVWVAMVAFYLLSMQSDDMAILLPMVERLVNATSLVLVVWVFITADQPEHDAVAGLILAGSLVFIILLFIFTGLRWAQINLLTNLNQSILSLVWIIFNLVIGCISFSLIYRERKILMSPYWKMGAVGIFTILQLLRLIEYFGGSPSGGLDLHGRVGLWVVMFCIPITFYIKIINGYERAIKEIRTQMQVVPQNRSLSIATPRSVRFGNDTDSFDVDAVLSSLGETAEIKTGDSASERVLKDPSPAQLLRTLGLILEETDVEKVPSQIVKACAEVLKADLAILLSFTQGIHADVVSAYDGARNKPLPTMLSINIGELPTMEASIRLLEQRVIRVENQPKEIEELYSRLEISEYGVAYFQPLMRSNHVMGIIVIAQPYSKRELSLIERELLRGIGTVVGHLLGLVNEAKRSREALEQRYAHAFSNNDAIEIAEFTNSDAMIQYAEMQGTIEAAQYQNKQLQGQLATLAIQLDKERNRLLTLIDGEDDLSLTERVSAVYNEQSRLRSERDELVERLQQLETRLPQQKDRTSPKHETATQSSILLELDREKQQLILQLNSLREQLDELRSLGQSGDGSSESLKEMIQSIAMANQQLESEKHSLQKRLSLIEAQLGKIDEDANPESIIALLEKTAEQRSTFHARTEALQLERDALLGERRRLEMRIRKEEEREAQLELMEAEIRHLATDREAIARQRDQYRTERTQLITKVDRIKEQRARLLADLSTLQSELDEYKNQLKEANRFIKTISDNNTSITNDLDKTRIELRTIILERDKLMAQIGGDLTALQQIRDDGVSDLQSMLTNLSTQKSKVERELNETRVKLATMNMNQVALESTTATGEVAYEFVPVGRATDSALIYQMVQELRTPMTSIVNYVDLLSRQGDFTLSQNHRRFIDRISANVVRLDTMLNDLTHLSALDAGQTNLELDEVNLVELVEDLITKATYQFHEKELTLNLSLEDNLPLVEIDVSGIQQVIGQLLNNAYIVSPPQSAVSIVVERLRFSVKDRRQTEAILIAVEDSGGGIDADENEVFSRNRFSEKVVIKGLGDTGIGLPIAKAIIEAHAGQMWLITHEGMGTTFNVALPLKHVKFD